MIDKLRGKLSRKILEVLFLSTYNQPWLENKDDKLHELIKSCESADEIKLISGLLRRYTYLGSTEFNQHIDGMAERIVNGFGVPEDKCQIVAMTPNAYDADSGQWILQFLKVPLAEKGWGKVKKVNQFSRSVKQAKKKPIIILVDEFIGSGKTVENRVTCLTNNLKSSKITDFCIKVCVIACMQHAKEILEACGIEVYAQLILKKGISEYYNGSSRANATSSMERMESTLLPRINDIELPSFGYGEAEALYAVEYGNIPNSVFPVFWWPKYADDRKRNALFTRVEGELS